MYLTSVLCWLASSHGYVEFALRSYMKGRRDIDLISQANMQIH
jgi:hypothetical protein